MPHLCAAAFGLLFFASLLATRGVARDQADVSLPGFVAGSSGLSAPPALCAASFDTSSRTTAITTASLPRQV